MKKEYEIKFPPFIPKNVSYAQAVVDQLIDRIDTGPGTIWNPISHFYHLYELAFGLHNDVEIEGHIVELGSYRGASACVMGQAIKNSGRYNDMLFTVDPYYKTHSGTGDYTYIIARENYNRLLLTNYICPIICRSETFLKFWKRPIRLAYIDASHLYEETKKEITLILPYIVPNGWLVCDDYVDTDGSKVMLALDDFLNEQNSYAFDIFQDKSQVYLRVKS